MLTIESLIAVLSLCIACYSLGYNRRKHDARQKNDRPKPVNLSDHFLIH